MLFFFPPKLLVKGKAIYKWGDIHMWSDSITTSRYYFENARNGRHYTICKALLACKKALLEII